MHREDGGAGWAGDPGVGSLSPSGLPWKAGLAVPCRPPTLACLQSWGQGTQWVLQSPGPAQDPGSLLSITTKSIKCLPHAWSLAEH